MNRLMKNSVLFGLMLFLAFPLVTPAGEILSIRATTNVDIESDLTTKSVTTAAVGDGIVNKYAIIVGISDYKVINDLSYCDEDATDWYNYLSPLGYEITLLGDDTSNYPQFDGLATEYNIKQTITNVIAQTDADDILVFTSSGHGADSHVKGPGRIYYQVICCWDGGEGENGESGYLFDYEFAPLWETAVCNTFIFLDHCYAGGMNELFSYANADLFYMVTTCTDDGYGYDASTYSNGLFTYWYLEAGLVGQGFTDLHECYLYTYNNYPNVKDGDMPQEFGIADFTL